MLGHYPRALADAMKSLGLPVTPDLTVGEDYELVSLDDICGTDILLAEDLAVQQVSQFAQIGRPGTPYINGRYVGDPNPAMRPSVARGSYGSTGIFDELMRENGVHKAVSSLTNIIATGQFELEWPERAKQSEGFARMEASASLLLDRFKSAGWDQFVNDMCSAILKGFAVFEVVYDVDEQERLYPRKFGFREQATVSRWILDPEGRDLTAVEFATRYGGDKSLSNYVLPYMNRNGTPRVLLSSVGRVGNNFEGLTPARTLRVIVDLKKLLLSVAGASFERFGCPILVSKHTDATLDNPALTVPKELLTAFNAVLSALQALDTPTLNVPKGLALEYLSPQGDVADAVPMLQYLDGQIALAFATQAQQLGHNGVGSYALASVQDDDLMRAAPAYARSILIGVNDVYSNLLVNQYNVPRFMVPRIVWKPQESLDVSPWLQDLERLNNMAYSLPRDARRLACERLGLSPDAYEVDEDA